MARFGFLLSGAGRHSYITKRGAPTAAPRTRGYARGSNGKRTRQHRMTEKHIFADVSVPFHVWVKEGRRWVLRDAASRVEGGSSAAGQEPRTSERRAKESRPSRH